MSSLNWIEDGNCAGAGVVVCEEANVVASAEVGVESGTQRNSCNATSLLHFFPSSILHGARSIVVVDDDSRRQKCPDNRGLM